MSLTSPNLMANQRVKMLCAIALGLSPMHPKQWEEIKAEAEELHRLRHAEIGYPCDWDPDLPLDDGCIIRYRIRREAQGLPPGWSFTEGQVRA